jgi:hypothetical protein
MVHSEIHKIVNSLWDGTNCIKSGRIQSLCPFMKKVIKQIVVIVKTSLLPAIHTIYSTFIH